MYDSPVLLGHREPLRIPWSNIDINWTEIVIFLMACKTHVKENLQSYS